MEALRPGDPERIGGYLLQARLGTGGMGQVFLARSPGGMSVALKVVHPNLAVDAGFRARFRREVAAARSVSGAFTASVVDADLDGRLPWLATAFLPGLSLQEAVLAHGPFPPPAVFALGAGLAEALESIHRAGVVHRDLKPSNVMLGPDGPRVIDFGIAYAADATVVTQVGSALGSPGFMAPEQAAGGATGPASDVFSFGAVLCYVATADGPFGRATVPVLLYRVVHETPRLDRVVDPELRGLIGACLDKDPARRPAAGDLLRRLAGRTPRTDVLQGTAWLPPPVAADIIRRTQQTPPPRLAPSPSPSPGVPTSPGLATATPAASALARRRLLVLGGSAAALAVGGGVAAAVAATSGGGSDGTSGGTSGGVQGGAQSGAATAAGTRAAAAPTSPAPTRSGKLRWKVKAGSYLISDPAAAAGIVYVGGTKGDLLALDATTGRRRWRGRLAAARSVVSTAPAVVGGVVYTGMVDGYVYALDVRTGRVKWRTQIGTLGAGAVVVVGDTIYVPSETGNGGTVPRRGVVLALHAATGAVKWRHVTNKTISDNIAVGGGVVYVPAGSLYALDAATGRANWTYKSSQQIQNPAVAGGIVYCGNFQGNEVHAVDAATGRRKWRYQTGGPVTCRPLVTGGTVYIGNWDGNMYALDAATGTMRWQLQTGGGQIQSNAALAGSGLICFAAGVFSAGDLFAVDAATGRPVWRYHAPGGIESSPAVAAGGVYFTCKDGVIYGLDVKGGTQTVSPTAE